jgi:NADP-dependent 3-hydroxy acid dehydrogenase YdfG
VRRRQDLTALVAHARHEYGRRDVLVNNAGVAPISLLEELRVEEWDEMIDINFRGVLYGIAAALPVFREKRRGHVVNVVCTAGLRIVPSQAVYAATKNAVRTLSKGLRQEAGPDLRVTMVSPGYVATELADSINSPAVRAQITAASAELAVPPDAVARAIAFAIAEPAGVDVGDIVVRPTAQTYKQ